MSIDSVNKDLALFLFYSLSLFLYSFFDERETSLFSEIHFYRDEARRFRRSTNVFSIPKLARSLSRAQVQVKNLTCDYYYKPTSILNGANSIVTLEIARLANSTFAGISSRHPLFQAQKTLDEVLARTVMSSFLVYVESLFREERSDSRLRPERLNKSARPFPFPSRFYLSLSVSLSLSSERPAKSPRSLTLFFSLSLSFLSGEELWNRVVLDRDTLSTLPVYHLYQV